MHVDALDEATRVVIIDDLIATGGTMCAAVELISQLGGETIECAVIIELVDLDGRAKLSPVPLYSLVSFHEDEA
ncbi:Adenine phosphoribosyltransferase [Geodia barretti]|uniref:adenine phosphoribosyltransferase n=4 Tax=Geodia barretti TaxID=519541 RepID=A0AA35SZT0_GEOBA|nr:Adenine phosphoribosyltransferase [Geodia barretti]